MGCSGCSAVRRASISDGMDGWASWLGSIGGWASYIVVLDGGSKVEMKDERTLS